MESQLRLIFKASEVVSWTAEISENEPIRINSGPFWLRFVSLWGVDLVKFGAGPNPDRPHHLLARALEGSDTDVTPEGCHMQTRPMRP